MWPKKRLIGLIVLAIFISGGYWLSQRGELTKEIIQSRETEGEVMGENEGGLSEPLHPLQIEYLRQYPIRGSDLVIEQTLEPGSNYDRYVASYQSEGLKIYGLLTVPNDVETRDLTSLPAERKYPVIIFNHGYIQPSVYRTTERYVAYVDGFARNGYIVFKPDYRGHGDSDGNASGAYGSPDYTIDVLHAVAAVKNYPEADGSRMGMWGHSMGGYLTLRAMVVSHEIKAGVIWGGVVGSYPEMLNNWRRRPTPFPLPSGARRWRQLLTEQFGMPEENPEFWNSISANSYVSDISGPIQVHHGTADESVPVGFGEKLAEQLKAAGKEVEIYTYAGDDHNLSGSFNTAMRRSVEWFDRYVKGRQF